jgi:histidine ammonia-lyase
MEKLSTETVKGLRPCASINGLYSVKGIDMMKTVVINGSDLTIEEVVAVARDGAKVELDQNQIPKILESRQFVEDAINSGQAIYGINTGFGKFENVPISEEQLDLLQKNLIYSDACGVGDPFDTEIVRAMLLLRANAVCKGFSGVLLRTIECMVDMLNKGVHPIVRSKGSVGASGDLCPLAHMVLPMIGQGEAEFEGQKMPGRQAMEKAGVDTITLKAKEGLALINGTQAITSNAVLAVYDMEQLLKQADIVSALTIEALEGIVDAFDERVHMVRPHKGQIDVARNLRTLLSGSKSVTRQGEKRMQDAYSLRCTPQVHGGSRLAFDYVKSVVETEINSVTDNPLIFPGVDGACISGGNFHGQPMAIAMDTLGILAAEIANISERRIERMVNPALSNGLPAFLVKNGGINDGFMIPQYVAAALVSENKVLAHPASVDSIPTSANQEDHVSMGTIGARHARTIVDHAQHVVSIELLCAAQAVDFRNVNALAPSTKEAYDVLREKVDFMENDVIFYPDMDAAFEIIQSGSLLERVERVSGNLL